MNVAERKKIYSYFLAENSSTPVYIQEWYLDLVCGKENWDVVLIIKSDRAVAVLPYFLKKNRLFRWIGMPPLSKLHGPYFSETANIEKNHHQYVDELLAQLPSIAFYQQGLGYEFKNWLPYLWKGYEQVTLYSYIFQKIDLQQIFQDMDSDCRRRIKKAEQSLSLKDDISFDVFFELLVQTYKRQKLSVPFQKSFLENYYNEMKQRSSCRLLAVVNNKDIAQSACLLIWDKQSVYYLLEGTNPDAADKNAAIYLKWAAIKYTKQHLQLDRFDFEGSISKRIEKVYREFGAEAKPYFVIKKYFSKIFLGIKFAQNYKQYGKLVQW